MSRPPIPINWERVDQLLEAGCLGTEIASVLGINPETFYNRVKDDHGLGFTEYACQKRAKGEAYIREAQFLRAVGKSKKGDNTMLIWLGKNRLNQKESNTDNAIPEELKKPLDALMGQLNSLQEDRSKVDKSSKSAEKSE